MQNMLNFKLEAKNFSFAYGKTEVFNQHSLDLRLTRNSSPQQKIYGIIGPSGTGKTTLLSILGGQLKPDTGQILINEIDIYQVDDEVRKNLLAIQVQTSTSLRGTLAYNLTFGLPSQEILKISDEYLVETMKSVDLWDLFANKEGLQTLIGENGLNLSGGQRQRLNFASLCLRANYYQPALILVDEPTSSLDEISESSITKLIQEISQNSVVFVVAHRLKTLESAEAILDSSLLSKTKQLRFYPPEELFKISTYYQDLQQGKVRLDQ